MKLKIEIETEEVFFVFPAMAVDVNELQLCVAWLNKSVTVNSTKLDSIRHKFENYLDKRIRKTTDPAFDVLKERLTAYQRSLLQELKQRIEYHEDNMHENVRDVPRKKAIKK